VVVSPAVHLYKDGAGRPAKTTDEDSLSELADRRPQISVKNSARSRISKDNLNSPKTDQETSNHRGREDKQTDQAICQALNPLPTSMEIEPSSKAKTKDLDSQ